MAGKPKSKKAASAAPPAPLTIGVIADTHGVLSPAILHLFGGVAHIIHAGDVGRRAVLHKLEKIAPVTAVSGNADTGRLAASLPTLAAGQIGRVRFLVFHKPKAVKRHLPAAHRDGVRLIVMGHLHEPGFRWEDGILFLNPGSATAPEEGDSQATVAIVAVLPEGLAVSFIPVPKVPAASVKTRAKTRAVRSGGRTKTRSSPKTDGAVGSSGAGAPRPDGRHGSEADGTVATAPPPAAMSREATTGGVAIGDAATARRETGENELSDPPSPPAALAPKP